jgi:hypothetical protein
VKTFRSHRHLGIMRCLTIPNTQEGITVYVDGKSYKPRTTKVGAVVGWIVVAVIVNLIVYEFIYHF